MIKVSVSKGIPYVWNLEDCMKLRKEHGIVGTFCGAVGAGHCSGLTVNLPLRLSDVETQFLVKTGAVRVYEVPTLYDVNTNISHEQWTEYVQLLHSQQLEMYKKKRKHEIESMVDKIIEGKRKKNCDNEVPERDSIVADELKKITVIPYQTRRIELEDPWITEEDLVYIEYPAPQTYMDKLRLKVFEDFRKNHKYYLTSGLKFGGDFLAYPGDPLYYHAEFIIMCEEKDNPFCDLHIISQRRLAQIVKKKLLVASLNEHGDVMYKHLYYSKDLSSNREEESWQCDL